MTDDFDISQIIDDDDEGLVLGVDVTTPSGATIKVMNQSEADYYDQVHKRYLTDNKFKNVSDILELDRILVMELCVIVGVYGFLQKKTIMVVRLIQLKFRSLLRHIQERSEELKRILVLISQLVIRIRAIL